MRQRLYPPERYPRGHTDLANSLDNLGGVLRALGEDAQALPLLERAAAMHQALAAYFFASASEAEALNYETSHPSTRDALISLARHLPTSDHALYPYVWDTKAAIARMVQRRQEALIRAADPETRAVGRDLLAARRQLATLMLTPADPTKDVAPAMRTLTERKEQLERQLADRLPEFRRQQLLAQRPAGELARRLPGGAVFIDCVWYVDFQQDPKVAGRAGERWTSRYAAFVLRPGQPAARVDLGPSAPIDRAIADWRADIKEGRPNPAATLRRLVWEALEPHLPAGTESVLLSPDGDLTRLPWAALPGRRPGTFLLEDYALAVVPNGLFLLDQLTAGREEGQGPGRLLAVGDVRYDRSSTPTPPADVIALRGPALRGDKPDVWPALDATRGELEAVVTLAGGRVVHSLTGEGASATAVLAELPKARWAHFATHGFFADPMFRSLYQLDKPRFRIGGRSGGHRAAPGSRNPLVLSGLVLAGANLPVPKDEFGIPRGDGGILTAESIAGLLLPDLELVVLSACETGLGEVAGGEGVFGLQRAFHTAGARTVIASLWQVDSESTRALMTRFYRNLWQGRMRPREALRRAQLDMVRHGPGASAEPYYWAAWVVSGDADPPGSPARVGDDADPPAPPARPRYLLIAASAAGVVAAGGLLAALIGLRRRSRRRTGRTAAHTPA
jgi:CHAT domain-containing protein